MSLLPLAHGVGGVTDPPIPLWLAYYGGAAVLVLSFAALGILWKTPRLEGDRRRGLFRLPSGLLRVLVGALGFGLFVVVFIAALVGERSAGTNIAPTFVWIVFWVGLVPLCVLFGNVWAWLNPWRAAADFVAWTWSRARLDWDAPFAYPKALGRWPAAFLLLAFAALELAYSDPQDPRILALAIALYSWITWVGIAAFGRDAWLNGGEMFTVYFGFLARLAPFRLREGRLTLRNPLQRVAREDEPTGTVAFVAVMLGSVAFDGFGRTSYWQDLLFEIESEAGAFAFNVLGLVLAVVVVAAAFVLAIELARRIGGRHGRLERDFAGTLIPIALAYVVAHYATLLIVGGQLAIPLASDPLGFGWDLFGTLDYRINVQPLSADQIWYVQTGALIAGHVIGLVLAHDKALAVFGTTRDALRTQYPLLGLMILYTTGGLWLLSRA